MNCRNCGRKLPPEEGKVILSDDETTLYVCSDCWTWTEEGVV